MIEPDTSQTLPRVLLVAFINSHLPEVLRVARFLKQTKLYDPVIVFVTKDEYIRQMFIYQANRECISIIALSGTPLTVANEKQVTQQPLVRTAAKKLIQRVPWFNTGYGRLLTTLRNLGAYFIIKHQVAAIHQLYQNQHASCLIFPEENIFYNVSAFVLVGRTYNIPSIIVPYTIANATEVAEHAYDNKSLWIRGWFKEWVARRYPVWVHEHRGKRLFPFSVWRVIATELHKLTPQKPWMFNSGFANAIAVESPFMQQYYIVNGLPKQKLPIIGSISDDMLYKTNQKAKENRSLLRKKLQLDCNKPIILCAFPPPWFPRPACEFTSFHQLREFWMQTLASQEEYNVIVNLHPRLTESDFQQYETPGHLRITDRSVAELIPLCDLYVANVSATIRWAIATGKPVINFDVYKYRFHDYDSADGVVTVETSADFRSTLQRCATDEQYLADLTRRQMRAAPRWGMLDGKCGQRLITLIRDLTAHTLPK